MMGSRDDRCCGVTDFADDLWVGYVCFRGDVARHLDRGIDGCAVEIDCAGVLVSAIARSAVARTRRSGHDRVDDAGGTHHNWVTDAPLETVRTPHDRKLIRNVHEDVGR